MAPMSIKNLALANLKLVQHVLVRASKYKVHARLHCANKYILLRQLLLVDLHLS